MALGFYTADHEPITQALHAYVDGVSGGVYETVIYVHNDDPAFIYTDIYLKYLVDGSDTWLDNSGLLGNTGFSVKMWKDSKPTELAWNGIIPSEVIQLNMIGIQGDPNVPETSAYYPVYIRVYCPGGTPTQIMRDHSLKLICRPEAV